MRKALEVSERLYGLLDPTVARDLNNLGQLLQDTNRLGEAEPLMRRTAEVIVKFTHSTGHPHPHLQAVINSYVGLLHARGRSQEQILGALRELAPEFFQSKST